MRPNDSTERKGHILRGFTNEVPKRRDLRLYALVWGFDSCEDLDDTNLFWSRGYYEFVALRLVNAGAVEANCKEARDIISVAKSIGPRVETKLIDEALAEDKYTVICCEGCNAHHYLGSEYGIDPMEYMKHNCQSCARGPLMTIEQYYRQFNLRGAK